MNSKLKNLRYLIVVIILLFTGCTSSSPKIKAEISTLSAAAAVFPQESQALPQVNTPNIDAPCLLPEPTNEKLVVHYLDVGQADSILIVTPGKKVMLIDTGNNLGSGFIASYIKELNIGNIDVLVGTHPHEDHIGSLDSIINTFSIGKIYMPRASSTTKTFEDVLNAIKNKGLKVTTAVAGVSIDLDPTVKCEILAPNGTGYEDLNNYSAVIKITFGNTSFLFDGDAEDISEQEMLARGYDLRADILKVGHHGSNSSTTSAFLKAVSPKYAVISVGKENDYGYPAQETLNKLTQANVQVFRTDKDGTIIATSDGKAVTFDKKASPIKPQVQPTAIKNVSPGIVIAPKSDN